MNEIQIGSQIWSTENATITKFRNGDDIPFVSNINEWNELTSPAYCINENNDYLYNYWVIIDDRNVAPIGWRVPTDNDWNILINLANGNDGWSTLAQTQLQHTDRIDLAINNGVLTAYPVQNLVAQQQGQVTKYSPSYSGAALDCQNKAEGLYCGTQNQAVLQYFKQATLPTLPLFVTLQRTQQ